MIARPLPDDSPGKLPDGGGYTRGSEVFIVFTPTYDPIICGKLDEIIIAPSGIAVQCFKILNNHCFPFP
jgi:hypothetical protein